MIYLFAFDAGFVLGLFVIWMYSYMRKRTYEIRVKEVKEELTQNKLGTEPSGTAKKPSSRSGTE